MTCTICGKETTAETGIVENVRTNSQMATLRDFKVMFVYRYADREGHPVFDLSVSPPDYL